MDTCTHGNHPSVLRSHAWRTAENSAGYLLDSLQPGQELLDVGCGPGTITLDLADRVAPGQVVGIDSQSEVIVRADELRKIRGQANLEAGRLHEGGVMSVLVHLVALEDVLGTDYRAKAVR